MSPFTINASGRAEIPHPAERALINVVVASSGENKASVSDEVITTAKHIESLLRDLSPTDDTPEAKKAAALAHWSKTSLSATSHVPWHNGKGTTPRRQYNARINFDIRFKDFKALGGFGSRLSALAHVEIPSIQWVLTAATEKSYRSRLRKEAARDALEKAHDYCEVLGCTNIRPVELEEGQGFARAAAVSNSVFGAMQPQASMAQSAPCPSGGLFGNSGGGSLFGNGGGFGLSSNAGHKMAPSGVTEQRDESELEFRPETVKMSMTVAVKFHAE